MRPRSPLAEQIHQWIALSDGWFSHFKIDSALGIQTPKDKTLRRVTLKRLCDKGFVIRADDRPGVYKRSVPAKKIEWSK